MAFKLVNLFEKFVLTILDVFRHAIHKFRRGSVPRGVCVLVLRNAERAFGSRLPRTLSEVRPCDFPDLTFEAADSMVMLSVYWFGVSGYEGKVSDVWIGLCRNAGSVLEIGGNVGLFTIIGSRVVRGDYLVVEPIPRIAAVLRANLVRNGIDRVDVREAAAVGGDDTREVILNVPVERHGMPVGAHLVDDVEVRGRTTDRTLTVQGLPSRTLFVGRDLIKIDAEGIEAELLASARDIIVANRPTMLVEVLPEAQALGLFLKEIAEEVGYLISIIPEYGSDEIVVVDPRNFTSDLPKRYNSKDVVLSMAPVHC